MAGDKVKVDSWWVNPAPTAEEIAEFEKLVGHKVGKARANLQVRINLPNNKGWRDFASDSTDTIDFSYSDQPEIKKYGAKRILDIIVDDERDSSKTITLLEDMACSYAKNPKDSVAIKEILDMFMNFYPETKTLITAKITQCSNPRLFKDPDAERSNGGTPLNDVDDSSNASREARKDLNGLNNNNTTSEKAVVTDVKGFGRRPLIATGLGISGGDGRVDSAKVTIIDSTGESRTLGISNDGFVDLDGQIIPIEEIYFQNTGKTVMDEIKDPNGVSVWFYDLIMSTRNTQYPNTNADGQPVTDQDLMSMWLSSEGKFEGGDLDVDPTFEGGLNESDESSTATGDALEKDDAKAKSQKSPENAPENVENSPALTKRNMEKIASRISDISPSIVAQNQRLTGKLGKPNWWAFRRYGGTTPHGIPANEKSGVMLPGQSCTIDGKIGSLPYYFGGDLTILKTNTGRVNAIPGKDNIVDFPIWMNFPEVGLWNKRIPYIMDNQTEQHMGMIGHNKTYVYNLPGGYGIGIYGGEANWGIEPAWCGITTNNVIQHGGYIHYHGNVAGSYAGAERWWSKALDNYKSGKTEEQVGFSKWGMFASIPTTMKDGESVPIKSFLLDHWIWNSGKNGSKSDQFPTKAYSDKSVEETYTEMVEVRKTVYEPDPNNPNKKTKKILVTQQPQVKKRMIPQLHYEQLLPNPTGILFLKGIHYNGEDGITTAGKRLLDHLFNQTGWEVGLVTRNTHVETLIYLNPDLTGVTIGGNTGWRYKDAGHPKNKVAVKKFDISWPGSANFICITKTVPTWGSQKTESNLNGKFKRTKIVNNYYSIAGKEPNVSTDLKMFYDRILD